MIVFCEECGEKYVIAPEKIKKDAVSFRCRVCDELIIVRRPADSSESDPDDKSSRQDKP